MRTQPSTAADNQAASSNTNPQLSKFDQLPDSAYVGAAVVMALLGVRGQATLWKWEQADRIPKSIKLAGSRFRSWKVGDLRSFIAMQEAVNAQS